jgi:hypothetical protein
MKSRSRPGWRQMWLDLLEGTANELTPADRAHYSKTIAAFKTRLDPQRSVRNRKKLEKEIDSFFDSDDVIKKASWTHLGRRAVVEITRAEHVMRHAQKVLAMAERERVEKRARKKKARPAKQYVN